MQQTSIRVPKLPPPDKQIASPRKQSQEYAQQPQHYQSYNQSPQPYSQQDSAYEVSDCGGTFRQKIPRTNAESERRLEHLEPRSELSYIELWHESKKAMHTSDNFMYDDSLVDHLGEDALVQTRNHGENDFSGVVVYYRGVPVAANEKMLERTGE